MWANILSEQTVFEWQLVGINQPTVQTSQGLVLQCDSVINELTNIDVMLWIGSQFQGYESLWQSCKAYKKHNAQINRLAHQCDYVIATCTSVSYLATSGFLDDYKVTSSWWFKVILSALLSSFKCQSREGLFT